MKPELSIAIVNTNNRDITLQCLETVFSTTPELNLEVFVVNNACSDGSTRAIQERFPQVQIIENENMLGFSTNNNLAFARARGRYLMLLNDDTLVQPGALQVMVSFMDKNPTVGAAGAQLLNPDRSYQKCYDHNPHPLYDGLQPLSEIMFPVPASRGLPLQVPTVHGACMLVRAEAAQRVGFLDTRFDPLYSEEVDWCFRIRKAGWKIYHLPEAQVIHLGGATMNRMPIRRYERIFEKKALFFRKHYGKGTVALYKLSLWGINLVKALAWSVLWGVRVNGAGDEARTHWHMVRRALFL